MSEGLAFMAIFIGIPAVLTWAYRSSLSHKRFMRVLELKAEMNSRLLDRVGTDPAALEFLKSDAQQQMFDVRLSEPAPRMPATYARMLTAAQLGLMLLSGGLGCLYIRTFLDRAGDQQGFLLLGTLATALGIGSILSAAVSFVAGRFLFQSAEGRG
jgi:hypothetical protein